METSVQIDDLSFSYYGSRVLENISCSIREREFVGVIGPNGGGKTTLLKLILGIITPESGSIRVLGKSPVKARSETGYMPQYNTVNAAMPLTVAEVVAMGLFTEGSLFPGISREDRNKIDALLERIGLLERRNDYFAELSGGQKQRTLLARAVISSPRILLLDEPTASVDYHAEKDVYEYLKQLCRDMTVILVSHDVSVVSTMVDTVICLNRKLAVHKAKDVTSHTLGESLYNTEVDVVHHSCNL